MRDAESGGAPQTRKDFAPLAHRRHADAERLGDLAEGDEPLGLLDRLLYHRVTSASERRVCALPSSPRRWF
jgi:hypothetical protein